VRVRRDLVSIPPRLDITRQRFAGLTWLTAVYGYLLIISGGIVRVTGSGLGCGESWPLCDGSFFPGPQGASWIDWSHRVMLLALIVPVGMIVWSAVKNRMHPGFGGRDGAARPVFWVVVLLILQLTFSALAASTELALSLSSLYSVSALLLVGVLLVASVRARGPGFGADDPFAVRRFAHSATIGVMIGFVVIAFGALTANLGLDAGGSAPSAAALACQGFPLCNGELVPKVGGAGLVYMHWMHRVLAYLLLFHIIGATAIAFRRGASLQVRRAALASLILAVMQITVAMLLVVYHLPTSVRILHLVVGAALWMALVIWAASARQDLARLDQEVG